MEELDGGAFKLLPGVADERRGVRPPGMGREEVGVLVVWRPEVSG